MRRPRHDNAPLACLPRDEALFLRLARRPRDVNYRVHSAVRRVKATVVCALRCAWDPNNGLQFVVCRRRVADRLSQRESPARQACRGNGLEELAHGGQGSTDDEEVCFYAAEQYVSDLQ